MKTPSQIADINGAVARDGSSLALEVHTANGESLALHIELGVLPDLLRYLMGLAAEAANARHASGVTEPSPPVELVPLPAEGLGFAAGSNPETAVMVIRVAGMDLAFEYPTDALLRALHAPELLLDSDMSPKRTLN
ncbi:hypothetical protein [Niveibacterium sp. SC-1]|uniref:hypothetical protein n=1 Tax=Niveibacterium sp. SC-1 TaxID=3135646 RepID=UPI00311F3E9C